MKELRTLLTPDVLKRDCQMCHGALKFLIEALGEVALIRPVGHILQCQEVLPSPVRRMGEGEYCDDLHWRCNIGVLATLMSENVFESG